MDYLEDHGINMDEIDFEFKRVVIVIDRDVEPPKYCIYPVEREYYLINAFDDLDIAIEYCRENNYEIMNSFEKDDKE